MESIGRLLMDRKDSASLNHTQPIPCGSSSRYSQSLRHKKENSPEDQFTQPLSTATKLAKGISNLLWEGAGCG